MKRLTAFQVFMVVLLASLMNRKQAKVIAYLYEYNRILKSKLEKDGRRIRYTRGEKIRLSKIAKTVGRKTLEEFTGLLTPDTLLRWFRELVAKKYTAPHKTPYSEAKKRREFRTQLILEIASENLLWGVGKIKGALKQLGIHISRDTIHRTLQDNGFDTDPKGKVTKRNQTWFKFIKTHFHLMVAADFFTVEVLTLKGLVRYMVFFVIDCQTRRVKIVHISHEFYGQKMELIAKHLTDCFDGFLKDKKYFFCDKDPLYTCRFRKILKDAGIIVKQVPSAF